MIPYLKNLARMTVTIAMGALIAAGLVLLHGCATVPTAPPAPPAAKPVTRHHCHNAPYLRGWIRACSDPQFRPRAVIVLDHKHYTELKSEIEQCIGRSLNEAQGIKLCHIPVVEEGHVPLGKEKST